MTDVREPIVRRLLIGESLVMRRLRAEVLQFGPTRLPVLVQGPTGSGKELVAQALHLVSGRTGALVAFNVCALGDGMFEDALFGHVRGAFTGATQDASGYLAEANGGTVFLDEISGLGMSAQAKLLRALETGVFRPVGGTRDRISEFRLVSASNDDLHRLGGEGRFRVDLLHRIGGCELHVPPLRERREDIPGLVRHFLGAAADMMSDRAMSRLEEHEWQGNVRQLRNVLDRVSIIAGAEPIDAAHVAAAIGAGRDHGAGSELQLRRRLVAALVQNRWDTTAVANEMQVHRATIYRWMNRFRITAPAAGSPTVEVTHETSFSRPELSKVAP